MNTDELKYTGSKRIYVQGQLFPDIQVAMREVELEDTTFPDGTTEPNEPVRIYDCSGPWGDDAFEGHAEQGLPALRQAWITKRNDVQLDADGKLEAKDLSTPPTQRYYAQQGIITPEMEYVCIRENLGRAAAFEAICDKFPDPETRPEEA
ncbi:MAG: phosphomethylpyrimidine synthase, partial [Akkermansia sp.]